MAGLLMWKWGVYPTTAQYRALDIQGFSVQLGASQYWSWAFYITYITLEYCFYFKYAKCTTICYFYIYKYTFCVLIRYSRTVAIFLCDH